MSATTIKAPPVFIMTAVQCVATVVLVAVSYLLWGVVSAYSVLLGGLISTVPNAYYARKVFRHRGARAMTRAVKAIYMGELVKLAMMGAGFGLAFKMVDPLNAFALFAGFVLVHVSGMAALVRVQALTQR